MLWEKKFAHWADSINVGSKLAVRIDLWNGKQFHFGEGVPEVIIRLPNVSALGYLLNPSLSNLGSAYVEGKIDVEGEPDALISIANHFAAKKFGNSNSLLRPNRKLHRSKEKDRQAVQFHYDISNEFYRLWLDEKMVYSCAYFENGDEDLATAQIKKIDHILDKIQLKAGERLLDIGCGWGALVIRAAQKYGAKCVGITLSENQTLLARERVSKAGLGDLIEIRLQDYRDVDGIFDKITSIGMFEHVGIQHLPAYFSKINQLLSDDGIVMNHGITSTDHENGETPFGNGEFIEKYVFPYGELPHLGQAIKSLQKGGLEVIDIENLRRHYARTCQLWSHAFEKKSTEAIELVGERRFRIWRVYLAGCRYAFDQDWISLYQVVCVKAGKRPSHLPWSRRYMYDKPPLAH